MGKKQCWQDEKKNYCAGGKYCTKESATKKIQDKKESKRQEDKGGEYLKESNGTRLDNPLTWTEETIDQVAKAVKADPMAEYASAFWNIYKGSFSELPCNQMLRKIILKAKKSYSTYATIPDEEYLGDVIAMMGEKMFRDWNPAKESLEQYIRYRCRPNAEYGRSILKAHGNRVYALVKSNGNGSFQVCEISKYNIKKHPDYKKKYINQTFLSADIVTQMEEYSHFYPFVAQEKGFRQVEENSVRAWLMEQCHVTEYELQICETIAASKKKINARTVQEINETIVIPAGNPPMTQKEVAELHHRIHVRTRRYYAGAIKGIR